MDMERAVVTVLILCVLGFARSVAEIMNDITGSGSAGDLQQLQPEGTGSSLSDFLENLTDGKGWDSEYFFEHAQKEFKEEGRDPLKKALLPFLIGITLKAASLVPVKLMVMTFVVIMALVFAKLGLVISMILGYLQFQQAHKASLSAATDKWYIPTTTHTAPVSSHHSSSHHDDSHHHHDDFSGSSSELKPAALKAPGPAVPPAMGNPSSPDDTKRLQHHQYDPYRYETFPNDIFKVDAFKFDPYQNDPFRFNRYDYPH